jgi:hypothetical protein
LKLNCLSSRFKRLNVLINIVIKIIIKIILTDNRVPSDKIICSNNSFTTRDKVIAVIVKTTGLTLEIKTTLSKYPDKISKKYLM